MTEERIIKSRVVGTGQKMKSCYLLVTDFNENFDGMSSGRRWRNKRFEEGGEWR